MGWQGNDSWERVHAAAMKKTWPVFCQEKYQPDIMLPRIRNLRGTSNFKAEGGSRGSPNIMAYLSLASEYRKAED